MEKKIRPLSKYPKMSMADRAKQFGSFDPLSGFSKAIRAKEIEIENEFNDRHAEKIEED